MRKRPQTSTAGTWKMPSKVKVYEALGAIADGRVEITGADSARVMSSGRDRTYSVKWSMDRSRFSSDDNASKWQNTMGYPIIAVLLALKVLHHDPEIAGLFKGIPWKQLNDAAKRQYDKVVERILEELSGKGHDRSAIDMEVTRIHTALEALGLGRATGRNG